jgi:uncharacterized protein
VEPGADVRALLASPLGLLIGISLGALGGGGSILAVPALVYGAGQSPKQATTTSLVLVALTALIGLAPHWRVRQVRVGAGLVFGIAGIGGSLLGSRWNELVDADLLLLAFAGLMLAAAYAMWRRLRRSSSASAAEAAPSARVRVGPSTVVKVAAAGTMVGVLTGFFGVGGGFVIVPALVLSLGFAMPEAAGTSLLVIAVNSAVALATRLDGAPIEWATVIPFTAASLIGVMVGAKLARHGSPASLQRGFIALLVVVALYTAASSTLALT